MTWLALALAQAPGTSVTPVDAATSSLTGYIIGFGPVGIFLVALAWLIFKGWRLMSPSEVEALRASARDEGRADLLKDVDRSDARADKAEGQRDEAQKITQDKFIPLLTEFTAATTALIPLLQELVRREGGTRDAGRTRR